jgi:hypothetical protein
MKKILIIFIFLFVVNKPGIGQTYRPFVVNNASWVFQLYDDWHNPTGCTINYLINGDTTINGLVYKKLHSSSGPCSNWGVNNSPMFSTWFLREDSKRVYVVTDTSTVETLVYDFNLHSGDTLFNLFGTNLSDPYCKTDTLIVDNTDSALYADGYHKRYSISPVRFQWTGCYIIEGIGNDVCYLLFPNYCPLVSGTYLLQCYSDSTGNNIYPGGWVGSCVVPVSTDEQEENCRIEIYPNPFTNEINFGKLEGSEITVTDIVGREIMEFSLSKNSQHINTYEWNKGVYFINIKTSSNKYIYQRVIKQ